MKRLLGFATAILIIVLLLIINYGIDKRSEHIYLIPNDYIGEVQIVYNQADGEHIQRNKRKLVFLIPQDGLLRISNNEPEYGWADVNYFYVNSSGEIIRELFVGKEIINTRLSKSSTSDSHSYLFTVVSDDGH